MIISERAHLHVAAITHPGRKGKNNEDRYGIFAHKLSQDDPTPSLFAIVADGVGGHRAGEVAAEMAIEIIAGMVADSDGKEPVKTLREAIRQASREIYSQAEKDPSRRGMSTTSACVWIIGERLYSASVGDSRIYLQRNGNMRQLTTDHTWVQEAVSAGLLSPDQAKDHPNAHVIQRHLGSRQPVVPDFRMRLSAEEGDSQAEANQGERLLPGDQVLICSDGLTDLVYDEEIAAILQSKNPDRAVRDLVDLANQRGGHDNITIVLLEAPEKVGQISRRAPAAAKNTLLWFMLSLGALLLLGGFLIGSLFWFNSQIRPTITPHPSTAPLLQPQSFPDEAVSPPPLNSNTASANDAATPTYLEPARTDSKGETQVLPTYTAWPTSTPEP